MSRRIQHRLLQTEFIENSSFIAELNKLGNEGWELVQIVEVVKPQISQKRYSAFLKRTVQ